jgi:uncharacterized membrane protein YhaH (DUF805 family)
MIMVAVGGFSCSMFKVEADGSTSYTVGYDSVTLYGDCVKFSDTNYDPGSALQAGKVFAIVVTVFGVLTVVFTIALTFVRFPAAALMAMAITSFVLAAFSCIVVGVGFAEDICTQSGVTCSPASMMYVVLVGLLFWIGAGVTLLLIKKFERPGLDAGEGSELDRDHDAASAKSGVPGSVTGDTHASEEMTTVINTVVNPDGTKTRTTTITHYANGQKIVECTTEPVPVESA